MGANLTKGKQANIKLVPTIIDNYNVYATSLQITFRFAMTYSIITPFQFHYSLS